MLRIGDRIKPPKRDKINASTRLDLTAAFPASPDSPVTPVRPSHDSALPICVSRRHVVQNQYSILPLEHTLCPLSVALPIHTALSGSMVCLYSLFM